LKVANLAIFNASTGPRNLEPSQIPDGLVRPRDSRSYSVVNAGFRCAYQLDHAIDMIIDVDVFAVQHLCFAGKIDRPIGTEPRWDGLSSPRAKGYCRAGPSDADLMTGLVPYTADV
jgi:hypothetical protein